MRRVLSEQQGNLLQHLPGGQLRELPPHVARNGLTTGASLHELWEIYEDGETAYDPDADGFPEPPLHVWCSPVRLKAWRDGVESARRHEVDAYYSRLDAGEGSLLEDDMWNDIPEECLDLGLIDENGRILAAADLAY